MLLFALSLYVDGDWSKLVSCILGFFAGMSLFIAGEMKEGTLTWNKIKIRLFSAFGVVFIGVICQDIFFKDWNTAIVVAVCTFFSESIVTIGSKGFMNYIRTISGTQTQDKDKLDV